jgi:dTDP-4-dehydrorhamnose reductase
MQILLLGMVGQLGWELQRSLAPLGELTAFDYPEINFAEPESLKPLLQKVSPQVIINAAAYTAVDRAESEPDLAMAINGTAPGVLAEAAAQMGAAFIHFSTEYVFDGMKESPYSEDDLPNPINTYGRSKLAGENAVQEAGGSYLVIRTSWVYSTRQGGFVNKVLEWARTQKVLRVVDDQVGSPTWCRMLADATALLVAKGRNDPAGWIGERRGLYHLAGAGSANRLEWAQAILRCDPSGYEQTVVDIQPAKTTDFPTPAPRPLYAPLDCRRFVETFQISLPPWEHSLKLALAK